MANNAIEVKCNFTTIFAKFNNIEDLKALANNICAQVKTAFDTRAAEIKAGNGALAVEVEVATTTPAPKTKGKAAAAKEVAARMKKEDKSKSTPKTETQPTSSSDDDTIISITDTAAIANLGLTFEKYNDRCWVLRGNTKPLRKILKEQFRGVFNSRLTGGEGWVFKTSNAQSVGDALGLKIKVA